MKFYQSGRSMVEMLGVLAIIGVLSVGAISGYSKAMMKYKLNKQTEQLNYLMNTITSVYRNFVNYNGTYMNMLPYLKKLHYLPEEMLKKMMKTISMIRLVINMLWVYITLQVGSEVAEPELLSILTY